MNYSIKRNKGLLIFAMLLNVITAVASVFIAKLLQKIIDLAITGDMISFQRILVITVLYIIILGLLTYWSSLIGKKLICKLTKTLRERVFYGIVQRNMQNFGRDNSADYISALTNDIKLIEENYFAPALVTLQYIVIFLVTCIMLFQISPFITACLFFCMILMLVLPGLIGNRMQARQDELSKQLSMFTSKLKDFFSGFEVIKSYRMELPIKKEFNEKNHILTEAKYRADKLLALNEGISGIFAYLTQLSGLFLGAYMIIQGKMSLGTLVAVVQLSGTFISPVMIILQNIPLLQGIKPVIARMSNLENFTDQSFQGRNNPSLQKGIEVKELNFSYDQEKPVIRDVTLQIEQGKKYAIVGKSGCGKTTFVKLLTGNLSEYSGIIRYDNNELHELDMEELQNMISVIQQNVYIFDSTIQHNITLYQSYEQQELEEALQMSGADQFLEKIPEGMLSLAGENGASLSGGQRQRIAVARALIRKKRMLVLDEGTSAVDMQTAYDIEHRLLDMGDLTLITITHKLSDELLKLYDYIIYMEDGRIEEVGSLEELINNNAGFLQFYTLQQYE